ncbi:taste receptor type 2 member 39-like [Pseudophryne corroboree]|uniref:taste receptor type 2 member 39-like n=1 Tax=Pseudophryne corroboree TaxID=495146 RepID=UPI003081D580
MSFATLIFSSSVWFVIAIGVLLNAFIVTQVFIWWLKLQTLQTIDIIMASLGAVRIILLIMSQKDMAVGSVTQSFETLKNSVYHNAAIIFLSFCSLWLCTVLCVFYFVKITNYSNRLFMRLKMNISRMVPWLLLTSLLVSFLSSLPSIWCIYGRYINSTQDSNSSSFGDVTIEANYKNLLIIYFTGSLLPFLIFCASVCLLIMSLLKHTRNMSSKDSGFTKIQLEAHISAIRNIVYFLFFYALYIISSCLMILSFQTGNLFYVLICRMFASVYPTLHSAILIASNANLKHSLLVALRCARASNPNDQMP